MTLPPFVLHRPSSVEEATALLVEHGDDAAAYCGGTELLLLMKLGFAVFDHLVDLRLPLGSLLGRGSAPREGQAQKEHPDLHVDHLLNG